MNFERDLALAKEAARKAGQHLRATSDRRVVSARGRDIKLVSDRESESLILGLLGASYPCLSEEAGATIGLVDSEPHWVIDPLDGTYNFSRHLPWACVSIALWQNGRPLLGVVYDFFEEVMYSSVQGGRAYEGNSTVSVNSVGQCSAANLATGLPVQGSFEPTALSEFAVSLGEFRKVRMIGSAAMSLAWVASGRFDAYKEDGIMLWDVAAGLALVEGAGGVWECGPSARPYSLNVLAACTSDLLDQMRGPTVGEVRNRGR